MLAYDPFGNFAISEMIKRWSKDICAPIFESLKNHLSELCI
jgi:hypothetical protein